MHVHVQYTYLPKKNCRGEFERRSPPLRVEVLAYSAHGINTYIRKTFANLSDSKELKYLYNFIVLYKHYRRRVVFLFCVPQFFCILVNVYGYCHHMQMVVAGRVAK